MTGYIIIIINILSLGFVSTQTEQNSLLLTLSDGMIQGSRGTTAAKNKSYSCFKGIPFAKPPIGDLRFEPPVPSEKWKETLDATKDKNICVQGNNPVKGSEDCLYVNVYTTSLEAKRPVMVWIYGGAFITGGANYETNAPDYFLDEEVVFVSFNYRIGLFGFMSTGDTIAPGNVGIKDQVLALKWIKNNIEKFGGDSSKITIFGQSAGAASISLLLQIPATKGLYHGAIMQSGSSLTSWSRTSKVKDIAFKTGKVLKVDTTNSSTLIAGLKKIDFKLLQSATNDVYTNIHNIGNPLDGLPIGPVIEPECEGAVFTHKSDELLSKGQFNQVPSIIGFNSLEAVGASDLPNIFRVALLAIDLVPATLAPKDLNEFSFTIRTIVGNLVRLRYFGLIPITISSMNKIIKYVSDDQFARPIRQTVKRQAKYSPAWFYEFSYMGALGESLGRSASGVGHSEELPYLFKKERNFTISEKDELTRSRMVKLWTNFAKFLNPTPENDTLLQNVIWTPNNATNLFTYLDINSNLTVRKNPEQNNMRFYDNIYKQFGQPPYDTH